MTTRMAGLLLLVLMALMPAWTTQAQAQSEADRLREALRSATVQLRQLQDERAVLQSRLAAGERERTDLKAQVDAARAEAREAEKQHAEAVDEFNRRLAERDETLERWKSAYEEAANVARAKDAERAKFEAESTAYKASTKSCQDKNTRMLEVGRDLLQRYKALTIGDALANREPVLGLHRVETQNLIQDTANKLFEQKATP